MNLQFGEKVHSKSHISTHASSREKEREIYIYVYMYYVVRRCALHVYNFGKYRVEESPLGK
jgi:hypothetical protein